MARAKSKPKIVAAANAVAKHDAKTSKAGASHNDNGGWSELFSRTACAVAHWMGKPVSFLIATAAVIVWALTGPLFGYSDTWQLVINTSTTIVTFLMVFLIQNTQNRDTMALQLKLSELILVISEAENRFANAEDLTEEELERLHKELQSRAQTTLGALDRRRAEQEKKAS
jgi:low affinity Fe/Cu permease